jgi:PPM family protein phosphatase
MRSEGLLSDLNDFLEKIMSPEEKNLADTAEYPVPGTSSERHGGGPSSLRVHVDIAARSHCGHVRKNNEDYCLVSRFGRFLETLATNLPEGVAPPYQEVGYGMVVADGMGGMAAGEIASRTAVESLVELVRSTPDWILLLDDEMADAVMRRMAKRFRVIDEILIQKARDAGFAGMGTTMTLACTLGLEGIVCHIGDSRAYRFRRGELVQLTRDMSVAQSLVDQGLITLAEARTHRLRHALIQCLGGGNIKAEVLQLHLEDGDRLLLCSDGLTEMAPDSQIAEILGKSGTAAQTADALIEQALLAGGKDNVTVVLGDFRVQETT